MKNCPNCLNDFEPNSGKQKFCSDKCKVAYSRKLVKGEIQPKELKHKSFSEGGTILDQINLDNKKDAWVKLIEDFCNTEGILPAELIEVYKTKKVIKKDYVPNSEKLNVSSISGVSYFSNDLRKKKCGL